MSKSIEWSDLDILIIKDMFNNLVPIKKIANQFNVNEKTITALLHKKGIYFKRSIPKSEETKNKMSQSKKKTNEYKLLENYIVGYTQNKYEFFIDKEDLDLVKQYCWHKHQDGYLRTCYNIYIDEEGKHHNQYILMHKLIMQGLNSDTNLEIDHINGKPNDNRKINMREVTHSQNMKNLKLPSSNTSGIKGVHYSKIENKWKAYITYNKKHIHLGTFINKKDAINARKEAEDRYFQNLKRDTEDLLNGTR